MNNKEESPAARADRLTSEFKAAVETARGSGETLNVIVSDEVREHLEMYLKQSAEVLIEAETAPILSEMVVTEAAETLPHLTKGTVREALSLYMVDHRKASEREELIEELRADDTE